jgi:hypothetical protein
MGIREVQLGVFLSSQKLDAPHFSWHLLSHFDVHNKLGLSLKKEKNYKKNILGVVFSITSANNKCLSWLGKKYINKNGQGGSNSKTIRLSVVVLES